MECVQDIQNLTQREKNSILSVLRRDEKLKNNQDQKISTLKKEIHAIRMCGVLRVGDDGTKMCIRCRETFGFLFNRGDLCTSCRFKVCNACQEVMFDGSWACKLCFKQRQLKWLTGEWATVQQPPLKKWASGSDLIKASLRMVPGSTEIDIDDPPPARHTNNKGRKVSRNGVHGSEQERTRVEVPKDGDQLKLSELFNVLRVKKTPEQAPQETQVRRVISRPQDSESDSDSSSNSDVEVRSSSTGMSMTESEMDGVTQRLESPTSIAEVPVVKVEKSLQESEPSKRHSNSDNYQRESHDVQQDKDRDSSHPTPATRSPRPGPAARHKIKNDNSENHTQTSPPIPSPRSPRKRQQVSDSKAVDSRAAADSRVVDSKDGDSRVGVSKDEVDSRLADSNADKSLADTNDTALSDNASIHSNLSAHVARTKESLEIKYEVEKSKSQNSLANSNESADMVVRPKVRNNRQVKSAEYHSQDRKNTRNGPVKAREHVRKSGYDPNQANAKVVVQQRHSGSDISHDDLQVPRAGSPYSISMDSIASSHPSPTLQRVSHPESSDNESVSRHSASGQSGQEDDYTVEEISKVRFRRISRDLTAIASLTKSPQRNEVDELEINQPETQNREAEWEAGVQGHRKGAGLNKMATDEARIGTIENRKLINESKMGTSEIWQGANVNVGIDDSTDISCSEFKSDEELSWCHTFANPPAGVSNQTAHLQRLPRHLTSSVASDHYRYPSQTDSIEGMIERMVSEARTDYVFKESQSQDASLIPGTPLPPKLYECKSGDYMLAYITDDNLNSGLCEVFEESVNESHTEAADDFHDKTETREKITPKLSEQKSMGSLDKLLNEQGDFVDRLDEDIELEAEYKDALRYSREIDVDELSEYFQDTKVNSNAVDVVNKNMSSNTELDDVDGKNNKEVKVKNDILMKHQKPGIETQSETKTLAGEESVVEVVNQSTLNTTPQRVKPSLVMKTSLDLLIDDQGTFLDQDTENIELDQELLDSLEKQFKESMELQHSKSEINRDIAFLGLHYDIDNVSKVSDTSHKGYNNSEEPDFDQLVDKAETFLSTSQSTSQALKPSSEKQEALNTQTEGASKPKKSSTGPQPPISPASSASDMLSVIEEVEDEITSDDTEGNNDIEANDNDVFDDNLEDDIDVFDDILCTKEIISPLLPVPDDFADSGSDVKGAGLSQEPLRHVDESAIASVSHIPEDIYGEAALGYFVTRDNAILNTETQQVEPRHVDISDFEGTDEFHLLVIPSDFQDDSDNDGKVADAKCSTQADKTLVKDKHVKGKLFEKIRDYQKHEAGVTKGNGSPRRIRKKQEDSKTHDKFKRLNEHWRAIEKHEADILDFEQEDRNEEKMMAGDTFVKGPVDPNAESDKHTEKNDLSESEMSEHENRSEDDYTCSSINTSDAFCNTIMSDNSFEDSAVKVTTDGAEDNSELDMNRGSCKSVGRDVRDEAETSDNHPDNSAIDCDAKIPNINVLQASCKATREESHQEFQRESCKSIEEHSGLDLLTDSCKSIEDNNELNVPRDSCKSIATDVGDLSENFDTDFDNIQVGKNVNIYAEIESKLSNEGVVPIGKTSNQVEDWVNKQSASTDKERLHIDILAARDSCQSIETDIGDAQDMDHLLVGHGDLAEDHEKLMLCHSISEGEAMLVYNIDEASEACHSIDEETSKQMLEMIQSQHEASNIENESVNILEAETGHTPLKRVAGVKGGVNDTAIQEHNQFQTEVVQMAPLDNRNEQVANISNQPVMSDNSHEKVANISNKPEMSDNSHEPLASIVVSDKNTEVQEPQVEPTSKPLQEADLHNSPEEATFKAPPVRPPRTKKVTIRPTSAPVPITSATSTLSIKPLPEEMDSPRSEKLSRVDSPQTIAESECSGSQDDSGHVSGGSRGTTPEHKRTDSSYSQSSIPSTLSTVTDDDEDIDKAVAMVKLRKKQGTGSRGNLLSIFSDSRESIASYYSDAGDIAYGKVPVTGEILFSLNYNYKTNMLEVGVKNCRDIAVADTRRNHSDPYVKTYLLPDRTRGGKRKTKVKKHTNNPTFDETLRYSITKSELENRTLWVTVWHNDRFGRNIFLGEVTINFDYYKFEDPFPRWYPLQERIDNQPSSMMVYKGDLSICVRYVPSDKINPASGKVRKDGGKGQLQVMVKEARNLTGVKSNGYSDPFCKGYLLPERHKNSKQKTVVIKKDCNPVWNHTFIFEDVSLPELRERCLELTIWDYEKLTSNDFLGGVRLNLGSGVCQGKPVEWMDARGEEMSLWQAMLDRPNIWIDGALILRPNMDKRRF